MRTPTEAECDALTRVAVSWAGTPFADRGAVKGAGVTCHRLPAAIYAEAEWLPSLDIPEGPVGHARASGDSLMESWLDGVGVRYFRPVFVDPPFQPGDLLGFRLGRCIHHLALVIAAGHVVHAIARHGVVVAPEVPRQWLPRLARVWRPILT